MTVLGMQLAAGEGAGEHTGVAVVDDSGLERDDFHQRLGVEQEEHPGDAVGEQLAGAGEELVDPGEPLALAEGWAALG